MSCLDSKMQSQQAPAGRATEGAEATDSRGSFAYHRQLKRGSEALRHSPAKYSRRGRRAAGVEVITVEKR